MDFITFCLIIFWPFFTNDTDDDEGDDYPETTDDEDA